MQCLCLFRNDQRWSREHETRGQGHKKNSEAKNRSFRGHGQGPRTQAQVFSKALKKRSSKFFSGDLKKKGHQKFFFKCYPLEENKKKVFANVPQGFWRFPTKFQRFEK